MNSVNRPRCYGRRTVLGRKASDGPPVSQYVVLDANVGDSVPIGPVGGALWLGAGALKGAVHASGDDAEGMRVLGVPTLFEVIADDVDVARRGSGFVVEVIVGVDQIDGGILRADEAVREDGTISP